MARLIDMGIVPIVIVVVLGVAGLHNAEAAVYQVGDTTGWTTPSTTTFYADWAANKNFVAGDILEFNFATGSHDVNPVAEAAYTSCSTATSSNTISNGPANVTLTAAGMHYYTCSFANHCSSGMKLAVNVSTASSSPGSPSSSPSTPSTPSPPPPPSSSASSSSLAATLASVFMSIVLGSMCYFF